NFKDACEKLFAAVAAFFRKYADRPLPPRSYDHSKFDKWTQPSRPTMPQRPLSDATGGREAYQEMLFR
ncbi:MAG: hypothetical protein WCJ64_20170, partial [Rhodospirillaceae bacterium]